MKYSSYFTGTPAAKAGTQRTFTKTRVLVIALLAAVTVGAVQVVSAENARNSTPYQDQLRATVDTETGAPQVGRNPATQSQTSLLAAATQPIGPGERVDTPAASIKGEHRHVHPDQVLPDPKKTGAFLNGCLVGPGHGKPGEHCTPGSQSKGTDQRQSHVNVRRANTCNANNQLSLQGIEVGNANPFYLAASAPASCDASDLAPMLY